MHFSFLAFWCFWAVLVRIYSALVFHNRGDSGYSGFPPPPFPLSTVLLIVVAACFLPFLVVAHGCIARICQPWEQSPSRGCQAAHSESSWISQAPNFHFSNNYFFKASNNIIYHCQKVILFLFASSSLGCQFISVNFNFCLF